MMVEKSMWSVEEWYENLALEVLLNNEDDFLKIKETLTRIGIASRKDKKLFQSCHILHKRGKYYIVHFKELFALDGKTVDIAEDDVKRRNRIATLLEEWDLLNIVVPENAKNKSSLSSIKILSFSEKENWELVQKYRIGKKW
jgi:hypothetical protein